MTEPLTQAFIEQGLSMKATNLWAATEAGATAAYQLWSLFDRVDILLTPMLSSAPLPLGSFPMDHDDTAAHLGRMDDFAPYAALANITGAPALTLPFGSDANGSPLTIQLIAPLGGDLQLLSLGATLESENRWQHPIPLFGKPA